MNAVREKDTIRCFFAFELPIDVRRWICECVISPLSALPAKVRWVSEENIHLTVRFLGEVSKDVVNFIVQRAGDAVSGISPISMQLSELGTFGRRSPRVIWLGIRGETEKLVDIHKRIDELCINAGLQSDDKKFSPHITIGRVKSPKNTDKLIAQMKKIDVKPLDFQAEAIILFKSTLTKSGAIYEAIETIAL